MHEDGTPKIRVVIRKRPISRKQQQRGENDIIEIRDHCTVLVRQQKVKVDLTPFTDQYKFVFDGAYDHLSSNHDVYLSSVRPLVQSAFDGAKVTCFAYGQTGSGKTYTMLGDPTSNTPGLYLLGAHDIFQRLKKSPTSYTVWLSFYQIYCGKLFDLLNQRNQLFARQDAKQNVNIVGLEQRRVTSVEMLMSVIGQGSSARVTAQNSTNMDSSRSHAILQIALKRDNRPFGKMSFIDLAGSERAADHADQTDKQTRIDGAEINKSLLALKECIRALDQNKNHTPFRGSKLTMVLKDSFTGYCRTLMIGNISPNSASCENTLNTLKYADRVKELKKPGKDQLTNQMSNLDELSKQLMLPRSAIPGSENMVKKGKEVKESGGSREVREVPMRKQNNFVNPPVVQSSKQQYHNHHYHQPLQTKNISPSKYHAPTPSPPPISSFFTPHSPPQPIPQYPQHPKPSTSTPSTTSTHPLTSPIRNHSDFTALARKHQHFVHLIIEQQQQLVSAHQQHINSNIELIKQQMLLMNEADKIGSDIEMYLHSLDGVLAKELQEINFMREKVARLKEHLRESQQIERVYMKEAQNYPEGGGEQQEEEDGLFN